MTYKIFAVSWLITFITLSCTPNTKDIINIDGSSTVFPISQAIISEYNKTNPSTQININFSGTGDGFKKFCVGEIDINNASRAITAEERNIAKANNINFIELPIALDGITVVVNKNNTWATELTTEELTKIWSKESKVSKWSDLHSNWPDKKIELYGPGPHSGTFDYFTEVIIGKTQTSRDDYFKNRNNDVLVTDVAGDTNALGYLSYSYFKKNQDKLKAVAISHQKNAKIFPDLTTISKGTYQPLTRVLYLYINTDRLAQNKKFRNYMNFFMEVAPSMVFQSGFAQLKDDQYKRNLIILEKYNL